MVPSTAKIGDFHILPITIPPAPSFPQPAIHHVFLRRNEPKFPTPDDSRSLYLTNLPVDSTEPHLRAVFTHLVGPGRFESIKFERERTDVDLQPAQAARLSGKKRKREGGENDEGQKHAAEAAAASSLPSIWTPRIHQSGGAAVALLVDDKSVDQVLKAVGKLHQHAKKKRSSGKPQPPEWGSGLKSNTTPSFGSAWLAAHNRLSYVDKGAAQAAVDGFFAVFNARESEAEALAKRLRSEPDADGFVTVTRGGRNAPAREAEVEEARQRMVAKQEKLKGELTNFYRFQVREKRKAEQELLVRRFEEDRKKVLAMREKRGKFKPET